MSPGSSSDEPGSLTIGTCQRFALMHRYAERQSGTMKMPSYAGLTQILVRGTLAGVLFILLGAPGCQPRRFEWQGPTAAFKRIDHNKDGELSRPEWQATSLKTNIFNAEFRFMEASDCNRNGRLTWPEYFRGVLERESCFTEDAIYPPASAMDAIETYIFPWLLTGRELEILASRNVFRSPTESLAIATEEYPGDIHEGKLPTDSDSVTVACEDDSKLYLNAFIESRQPSIYPASDCTVTNTSQANTVTLLILKVVTVYADREETTWHAKSVFLPPATTMRLANFFPRDAVSSSLSLFGIRGITDSAL